MAADKKLVHQYPTCAIRFNGDVSSSFSIERGVKQGAVLSPILFCIVMGKLMISSDIDSLKDDLVALSRISMSGLATHADDIRTCNIGKVSIQDQAVCINNFTSNNSLALNNSKTEIVHLSRHPLPPESISILDNPVVTKKEAKCLGVWWCQDLSSRRSIEENILKSR